jgi:hypothetical protein
MNDTVQLRVSRTLPIPKRSDRKNDRRPCGPSVNRTGYLGGDVVWFLRRRGGILQVVVVAGFGLGR